MQLMTLICKASVVSIPGGAIDNVINLFWWSWLEKGIDKKFSHSMLVTGIHRQVHFSSSLKYVLNTGNYLRVVYSYVACDNGISTPFPFFDSKLKTLDLGNPLTSCYSKQHQYAVSRTSVMHNHRNQDPSHGFSQVQFRQVREQQ